MLYAGSDIGVFVSSDGGNTWNPFGTGLPRVAVFDMAFQGPNRLVRIATHGRGAWENAAAKAQALVTVAASPNPSTYGDNVTFTATVNPNGVLSNPTGTVTFTDGSITLGSASLTGSAPFTATFTPPCSPPVRIPSPQPSMATIFLTSACRRLLALL